MDSPVNNAKLSKDNCTVGLAAEVWQAPTLHVLDVRHDTRSYTAPAPHGDGAQSGYQSAAVS